MNLLDRAREMLHGFAPAPVSSEQEYSILCRQGHRVRGDRTGGYQALRCPSCNESLFVLPKSPLPTPVSTVAKSKTKELLASGFEAGNRDRQSEGFSPRQAEPGAQPDAHVIDGEIDWVDESPRSSAPNSATDPVAETPIASEQSRPSPKRSARRNPPTTPEIAQKPRESWGTFAVRNRNPLIFGGVLLLVAVTVMSHWQNARLAELPKLIEIGRVEGLAALDDGEFDKAKAMLTQAAKAVDQLGDLSQGAEAIKQGAKEAALFTDLNLESLERMIDLARVSDPAEWGRTFKTLYKNRSILIDAKFDSVPEVGSSDAPTLDYTILCGNGPKPAAKGHLDLTGFELLASTTKKKGDGVLFGARLQDISLDVRSGFWLVKLAPGSGVFLRHPKALESIGFVPEPAEETEKQP